MTARQQLRRDAASAWMAANPVLLAGEAGFETDTGRLKVGDGTTAWADLPYAFPRVENPEGGADNYAPIEGPTFSGTTTVETLEVTEHTGSLDVDGAVDVEPTDPDAVPLTVRGAESQAGDLAVLQRHDGTTLLAVSPSGEARIGDDDGCIRASSSPSIEIRKDDDNAILLAGQFLDTPNNVLSVFIGGQTRFRVRGDGRALKLNSPELGANDLLNRRELDDRFLRRLSSSGEQPGRLAHFADFSGTTIDLPYASTWVAWFITGLDGHFPVAVGSRTITGQTDTIEAPGANQVIGFAVDVAT